MFENLNITDANKKKRSIMKRSGFDHFINHPSFIYNGEESTQDREEPIWEEPTPLMI
jgi:hypothetical protein